MDYWPPFHNPKARSTRKFWEKTRDWVNYWWETWVIPIAIIAVVILLIDRFLFPVDEVVKFIEGLLSP